MGSSLPSTLHKGMLVEKAQSAKQPPVVLCLKATKRREHLVNEVDLSIISISETEQSVQSQKK